MRRDHSLYCCWFSPAPTTYPSQSQHSSEFSHWFVSPDDPSLSPPSYPCMRWSDQQHDPKEHRYPHYPPLIQWEDVCWETFQPQPCFQLPCPPHWSLQSDRPKANTRVQQNTEWQEFTDLAAGRPSSCHCCVTATRVPLPQSSVPLSKQEKTKLSSWSVALITSKKSKQTTRRQTTINSITVQKQKQNSAGFLGQNGLSREEWWRSILFLIEIENPFCWARLMSTQYTVFWCFFHAVWMDRARRGASKSIVSRSLWFLFTRPTSRKNTVCPSPLEFQPPGINPELMMECKLIAHPTWQMYWKKPSGIITLSCHERSMRLRPEWPSRAWRSRISRSDESAQYWYFLVAPASCHAVLPLFVRPIMAIQEMIPKIILYFPEFNRSVFFPRYCAWRGAFKSIVSGSIWFLSMGSTSRENIVCLMLKFWPPGINPE